MIAEAALLDSNVLIALLAVSHTHHAASLALFEQAEPFAYAVAAHSMAETYSTLTRESGPLPFRFSPSEAAAALESVRAVTRLIGLTPGQTFEVVRTYAAQGGAGPRLYDALIGACAQMHGLETIVTWNTRHMAALFPAMQVVTPVEFLAWQRDMGLRNR